MPYLAAMWSEVLTPPCLRKEGVSHLAVMAVRGVLRACSIVLGLPPCVPGRTKPETGRPDWEIGLIPWLIPLLAVPGGLLSDVPGPGIGRVWLDKARVS